MQRLIAGAAATALCLLSFPSLSVPHACVRERPVGSSCAGAAEPSTDRPDRRADRSVSPSENSLTFASSVSSAPIDSSGSLPASNIVTCGGAGRARACVHLLPPDLGAGAAFHRRPRRFHALPIRPSAVAHAASAVAHAARAVAHAARNAQLLPIAARPRQ